MMIELFGLSNTGKSYLKRKLEEKRYLVLKTEKISSFIKIIYLLKYLLRHPINTIYLFYILNNNHLAIDRISLNKKLKVLIMRNSYLAFVLSKYEQIKNKKERIFIDEFSFQSLFMILQNKSSEENIQKIIRKLPKSDILFVFEANREKRHKAYKKLHPYKKGAILLPASWIDKNYAKSLMEVMEYNFEIIKKIILKNYNEDKEAVSEINKIKLPKEYKRDIKISVYRK